jgi:hypothetical protein
MMHTKGGSAVKSLMAILAEYAIMKNKEKTRVDALRSFDSEPVLEKTLRSVMDLLDDYSLQRRTAREHFLKQQRQYAPVSLPPVSGITALARSPANPPSALPSIASLPPAAPADAKKPANKKGLRDTVRHTPSQPFLFLARKSAKPRKLNPANADAAEPLKQLVTNDDLAMKFAQHLLPHLDHSNAAPAAEPALFDHASNHAEAPADFDVWSSTELPLHAAEIFSQEILNRLTSDPELASIFHPSISIVLSRGVCITS